MLDVAKMDATLPPPVAVEDVSLGTLLAACDAQTAAPLVFSYEGRTIRPGYHVTEVKAGQFAALDCGGNPEAWSEIFVQLWDVIDGDRTHMNAGKFAAIIRKVSEHVGLDLSARLTFEVSDGVAPMQLHCAGHPRMAEGRLAVDLSPRAASCKPRDRWLEEQKASACCGPSTSKQPCCG
nr:DUF6428 family protein [Methylobacterium currus]